MYPTVNLEDRAVARRKSLGSALQAIVIMGGGAVVMAVLAIWLMTQDGGSNVAWPVLLTALVNAGWLVWAVLLRRRLQASWQRAEVGSATRTEHATVLPWVSRKNGPRQRAAQMADGTLVALFFVDDAAAERLGDGEITVYFFGTGTRRTAGPASVRTASGDVLWLVTAFVGAERSSYR